MCQQKKNIGHLLSTVIRLPQNHTTTGMLLPRCYKAVAKDPISHVQDVFGFQENQILGKAIHCCIALWAIYVQILDFCHNVSGPSYTCQVSSKYSLREGLSMSVGGNGGYFLGFSHLQLCPSGRTLDTQLLLYLQPGKTCITSFFQGEPGCQC